MRKGLVSIGLALVAFLCPSLVWAGAGITVIDSEVHVHFPTRAVFTLEAESSNTIVDVRLRYQVDKMNYVEVVSEGWAEFAPATKIQADWVWDMTNAGLPPGAEVTYWWLIRDAADYMLETSPQLMHFDDSRYAWRSLTGTLPEGGELRLFWYEGSESFAQELVDVCQEAVARLSQEVGTYPERPIKIYIYASTSDLRGAMIYPSEWSGGVAFTEFSTIAIGISPSELNWGKKALVHELTHLVVGQATYSPYGQLPLWLDEGLAMYNEGELDPAFRSYLEEAISKDELISVRSLCSPFSAYREKACLSYAQSYSLVEYLLENYGRDKMLDLLAVLKEGNTYDEALLEVYGFDIDGLDTLWRASLGLGGVSQAKRSAGQTTETPCGSRVALFAGLATLATGLLLWGVLTLKKRSRQRLSAGFEQEDKP